MKNKKLKDKHRDKDHKMDGCKRKDRADHRGAKTFRRGRAIAFLEVLKLKRATIKQQLVEPEFQSINQILVGELKALDMVINEYTQLFEIHESEVMEAQNNEDPVTSESDIDEEGLEENESV